MAVNCVLCEVQFESLHKTEVNFRFQREKWR